MYLQSIVETIVFYGRQNIPLRGHRDSGLDVESSATTSHGNFWALLEFRVAAGDSVLRDHLAKAPRNAMYTSQKTSIECSVSENVSKL